MIFFSQPRTSCRIPTTTRLAMAIARGASEHKDMTTLAHPLVRRRCCLSALTTAMHRYAQWYSSTFNEGGKSSRSSLSRRRGADQPASIFVGFLLLAVAIGLLSPVCVTGCLSVCLSIHLLALTVGLLSRVCPLRSLRGEPRSRPPPQKNTLKRECEQQRATSCRPGQASFSQAQRQTQRSRSMPASGRTSTLDFLRWIYLRQSCVCSSTLSARRFPRRCPAPMSPASCPCHHPSALC